MRNLWLACAVWSIAASVAAQGIAPVPQLSGAPGVERVRTLYVGAAYEDALAAIPAVSAEPVTPDLEQYRALCLLALGREQEAVAAVERLVKDHPLFRPSADLSPRMQTIVRTARTRVIPDLAKRAYASAKTAFESKNREGAQTGFQRTIDLIASLPAVEQVPLSDLQLLASEFLTLLNAANPPSNPPDPQRAPATALATVPTAETLVAPVTIREKLPQWVPPDPAAGRTEYVGLIRVHIGADGRVSSATILKESHPAYDVAMMTAVRQWVYRPAMRGGQPVATFKDIQIRLVPQ